MSFFPQQRPQGSLFTATSAYAPSMTPPANMAQSAQLAQVAPSRPNGIDLSTWWSLGLGVAGTIAICWGLFRMIATFDPVGSVLDGDPLVAPWSLPILLTSSVVLLAAFIVGIVAIIRSRQKLVPILVTVALLIAPPVALSLSATEGTNTAVTRITADIRNRTEGLSASEVEELVALLEQWGVVVPGSEELISILETVEAGGPL